MGWKRRRDGARENEAGGRGGRGWYGRGDGTREQSNVGYADAEEGREGGGRGNLHKRKDGEIK